ncbi:MAG: hypothetical protein ABIK07_09890 [Planctomycetota bacterium]
MKSVKRRHGSTGMGVIAGIIGTLLVLALVIVLVMVAMGSCPLCGNMMN